MSEIWKDIDGYEGIYQVSSLCRIRSFSKIVKTKGGGHRTVKGRILKPILKEIGYYQVTLCDKNSRRKSALVHILAAQAFVPNPHKLPQVNHENGLKGDNRIANFKWVSNRENSTHSVTLFRNKKSIYSGVHYRKDRKRWVATLGINGRLKRLGSFKTEQDASVAYQLGLLKNGIVNNYIKGCDYAC